MDRLVKYFVFLFVCSPVCGYNYTTCYNKRVNITNEYPVVENGAKYPEGIDCVWEIFTTAQFGLKVFLNKTDFDRHVNGFQLHNETNSSSYLIYEQNPLLNQNQSIKESSRLFYAGDEESSTFVSHQKNLWIVFITSSSPTYNYSLDDSSFLQYFPIFYHSVPLDRCEYPDHSEIENRDEIAFFPIGSEHMVSCNLGVDGFFSTINLTLSCILGEHNIPIWNDSLSNCQQSRLSIRDLSSAENTEDDHDQSREKLEELFSGDYPNTECGFLFADNKRNVSIDEYFQEKSTCNFTVEVKYSDELELLIYNYSTNSRAELLVFGNDGFVKNSYNLSQIKEFPKEFHLKTKKVLFTFWIPENGNLRLSLTYSGKNKTSVECYPLKPPLNGYLSTNDSSLGAEVEFFCDNKYHLDGENDSTCELSELGNARWKNPIPNCLCTGSLHITKSTVMLMSELIFPTKGIKQNCIWNVTKPERQSYNVYLEYSNNSAVETDFVLTIKDANVVHKFQSESLNSTLTFIHTILSDNVKFEFEIYDALNTNFSQIRIIFESYKEGVCSYPSFNNGKVSLNQLVLGTVAVFTCNRGYEMVGEDKMTCIFNNDSKVLEWSRDSPSCLLSDCSDDQPNDRNATAGTIVSPGRTSAGIKGNLNCTWNILYSDTDLSKTIEISVHYFNLSNCLQIVEINSHMSDILIKNICNNSQTPVNFTSRQKQISLRYVGSPNDTLGYKGFSIEYHVIPTTMTIATSTKATTTTTQAMTTTTQATTTTTQATTTTTQATTTMTQATTTTTQVMTTTQATTTAITTPPPPTTTTESRTFPLDEDKITIIVPLLTPSSLSPSGKIDKVKKYDADETGSASKNVVVYTEQNANSTTPVKSANGGKNYRAITAGIIIPLLIVLTIGTSFYIWYRKKYPVRMIVGKEFSHFTNPLYIKGSNSVSVNINPELPKAKPQLSLVIAKPNPLGNTGKDNLGFENESDLKHLESIESEMCQLEGENIQLELRGVESFDGQIKEIEENAEESKRRESRVSKNASMNGVIENMNIAMESEASKTLDANVAMDETPEMPLVAIDEVKIEEDITTCENDAVAIADDKLKNETNAEESKLQVADDKTDAGDNMVEKKMDNEDNSVKENPNAASNNHDGSRIMQQSTINTSQKTESCNEKN